MNKSNLLSFLMLSMILISCKTIYFKQSQPFETTSINEFPESIRGLYTTKDNDTLKIGRFGFDTKNNKSQFKSEVILNSDSLTLKQLNDYYVLSMLEEAYWEVFLLKSNNDTLTIYNIDINDDESGFVNKISKITPVRIIKNEKGEVIHYLINPSKKQFEQLIDLKLFIPMEKLLKIGP